MIFSVVLIYLIAVFASYIYGNKSNSAGFFFLIIFGVTNISRYILSPLSQDDIKQGSWVYWGYASDEVFFKSSLVLIIFLLAILINEISFKQKNRDIHFDFDLNLFRMAKIIIYLAIPFVIYKSYLTSIVITEEEGYLSTFLGSTNSPMFVNIISAFTTVGFYALIASNPRKGDFLKVSTIYLLTLMLTLMTGQRTDFFIGILLVILGYLFINNSAFRINLKFAILFLFLTFFAILVNDWRLGNNLSNFNFENFLNFFWGQGVSLSTIYGLFENEKIFFFGEGWFFWNKFFSCDLAPYFTGEFCHGLKASEVDGVWWQKLSYNLDPIVYEKGGGLGGSAIVSFYLLFNTEYFYLNLLILWLTTFTFMRLMYKFIDISKKNRANTFFLIFFLNQFIFFPRAGLDSFIPHPRVIVTAMLLFLGYKLLQKIPLYSVSVKNER